jgi:PAS domain S-box-containing protein
MGIRRPNSEIRWISINTRLLGKTDPSDRDTVVASFHDITGFKRSEAELAEATRFAESIAEQTTCIIYILDLEKEILTYANRSVGEFLGYGLETIAKMGDDFLPTINHPDDLAMVHERLTAFKDVADGQVVEYTTRCKHANGDWRSLWHRQVVFRRNPDGRPCQVMGTTQDITDLLKIQEELASARDAANLANRAKSQFLANMSHEIRTPMTAILGFADRLQEPDLTDADRTDCVQTIRRNGAHLMKVIDDILDLSKIEAGKMTVERIPVNPKKKVQDVVSLLEPRARERGLRLTVSFQSGIPGLILSDPTRILQILTNLVGNAIKFTARGQVRVEVSMSGPVGARRLLRFAVIDTGAGMTPDQLSRLFRPFSQADASTTRKYGGTGLGLAICRGLAERLGGTLHAQSMLGKGSAFTLTLDPGVTVKAQIRSARDAGVSPRSALPRLDARILLVEDGEDNQRLISHFLRSAGAKVTLAGNGKIACDLANNSSGNPPPFDLILMDMQMPGMDGYTATQTLRSSGWTGPILALTAHSLEEERRSCLTAGCSGFLAKPITRERLIRSAHEAVSDPRLSNPFLNNSAPRQPAVLDRAIAKLLSEYTSELPRLADEIEQFTKANDLAALGVAAHRLRGSGGSYGFPAISAAATNVEEAALSNGPADMLHAAVEELVQAMRRASQP